MTKSYFTKECLETAINQKEDSRNILIYIDPEQFLSVAMSGHSDEKMNNVKDLTSNNIEFNEVPFLNFVHDGEGTARVTGHEGRHRAKILVQLGVKEMPVLLKHVYDENGQPMIWQNMNNKKNQFHDMWPERLYGERGSSSETNQNSKNHIDFPIKDLRCALESQLKKTI